MRSFEYLRPESAAEAVAAASRFGPDARCLLGGTDLLVRLRSGRIRARAVIDLKRALPGAIELGDGALRIDAGVTMAALVADARVRRFFPALAEAAGVVGSVQIRNRATLSGNICNASPAADTAAPLLVYGARVNILGVAGKRTVPLNGFSIGPGRTVLNTGELVESLELPLPEGVQGSAFGRVTRRRGVDLATINLSCLVTPSGITHIAYGAAAPVPFLVSDQSGTLADSRASAAEKEEVLRHLISNASPITDIRGGREYRAAMLMTMSRRALGTALAMRERAQ